MKITYDVKDVPKYRSGKSEEVLSVIAFLASKHKNMCFEYENKKECVRGCDSVRNYRKYNKLQEIFTVSRRANRFYVEKIKKSGGNAK